MLVFFSLPTNQKEIQSKIVISGVKICPLTCLPAFQRVNYESLTSNSPRKVNLSVNYRGLPISVSVNQRVHCKHIWWNLSQKESSDSLIIDRFLLFPLTCFTLVTFSKTSPQIFRRDRFSYARNILFHRFSTFEVMTHYVAGESFLSKYFATLF